MSIMPVRALKDVEEDNESEDAERVEEVGLEVIVGMLSGIRDFGVVVNGGKLIILRPELVDVGDAVVETSLLGRADDADSIELDGVVEELLSEEDDDEGELVVGPVGGIAMPPLTVVEVRFSDNTDESATPVG